MYKKSLKLNSNMNLLEIVEKFEKFGSPSQLLIW